MNAPRYLVSVQRALSFAGSLRCSCCQTVVPAPQTALLCSRCAAAIERNEARHVAEFLEAPHETAG